MILRWIKRRFDPSADRVSKTPRSYRSAVAVFLFSISITLITTYVTRQWIEDEERARFRSNVDNVISSLETRIDDYINALYATQGFMHASSDPITRTQFKTFVQSLRLEESYPGVQGIGFTARIHTKDIPKVEQFMRTQGYPNFKVWPRTQDEFQNSILYLEPEDWRNQRAIGYDMSSEEARREAMDRARKTKEASASGMVRLVQEVDHDTQPGFLIYVPVFKNKELTGFVYSPFRVEDLFSRFPNPNIQLSVYDQSEGEVDLLFTEVSPGTSDLSTNHASVGIEIAGRHWIVGMTSTPQFEIRSGYYLPFYILGLGLVISFLLLALLMFSTRLHNQLLEELAFKEESERRILESQKEAEQANQAKTQFLANMSHEIRTPLGVIMGFADLALSAPVEEAKTHLKKIKKNSEQLAFLVGEVLDLSKVEASKLEFDKRVFSLPRFIHEIVSSLDLRAKEKGLTLIWDRVAPIPDRIYTDPNRLKQVLFNLIGNAIKFTESGGVRLEIRLLTSPQLGLRSELEFLISDSGIGIRDDFRMNLFKPFSQADPTHSRRVGGTGLGLALSREIARALGGDIQLKSSQPGKGSVFSVVIDGGPFSGFWDGHFQFYESSDHRLEKENLDALKGKTVLVVEDSRDNQILVERYLTSVGIRSRFAGNGQEAVSLLKANHVDLVLMDIQMPIMDGYEAASTLRARDFKKPIIALTAHALKEERERAARIGFNDYITKPIDKGKLFNVLIQHLS